MDPEAGDGARTHDPQLGKLMLYRLSYAREASILAVSQPPSHRRMAEEAGCPGFDPGSMLSPGGGRPSVDEP